MSSQRGAGRPSMGFVTHLRVGLPRGHLEIVVDNSLTLGVDQAEVVRLALVAWARLPEHERREAVLE